MQKSKKLILISLLILAGFGAYNLWHAWYYPYKFAQLEKKIVNKILTHLDADARAGQVVHIAIPGKALNDENRKILAAIKPGGIIFFGFNIESPEQLKNFTADLQLLAQQLKIPPFLISTDQEGGYVKRVRSGVIQTPPAMNLGDVGDAELCRATGYYVSRDLGKLGINVFFAPVVDINNNPKNPVIGLRSFGTTIEQVTRCALPFEAGARQAHDNGGALPVIKHFPGHGDTQTDSHWALPVIDKNLAALRAFELVPFERAIQTGALAVMTAHILYPQVDPDAPATLSQKWLNLTLRRDLKFSGLVFTDAMEMSAVSKHYADLHPPVAALKAGADILLYTSWQEAPDAAKKEIIAADEAGALTTPDKAKHSLLDESIERQIKIKLPQINIREYLESNDAAWYESYRAERNADSDRKPIAYDEAALMQKFAAIRWGTPKKREQPQWLAGQKN